MTKEGNAAPDVHRRGGKKKGGRPSCLEKEEKRVWNRIDGLGEGQNPILTEEEGTKDRKTFLELKRRKRKKRVDLELNRSRRGMRERSSVLLRQSPGGGGGSSSTRFAVKT